MCHTKEVLLGSMNLESFEKFIERIVRKTLQKHLDNTSSNGNEKLAENDLLTRKQAASLLMISLPTLDGCRKSGKIPAYRLGSRIRFKREDLENSLRRIESSTIKK